MVLLAEFEDHSKKTFVVTGLLLRKPYHIPTQVYSRLNYLLRAIRGLVCSHSDFTFISNVQGV